MFRHPPQAIFTICLFTAIVASLTSCVTIPNEQRIDDIPMYGQPEIPRPELLQKADEEFIKEAAASFGGSREDASKAWAKVADDFLRQGNLHYALRRYNQSWLLNPNNYHPYHGFGQIMLMRGKIDDSIRYLEKAKELVNDPYQKPAVVTDTGIAYSHKAQSIPLSNQSERSKYFGIANQHFEEATQLDKTYTESWRRWAYSLYEEGKYFESWEKVKKARSVGARPFPQKFLTALSAKMQEPR